jgi:hypothetical protein
MHRCDNRACCNPRHLQAADQLANLADMRLKGRAGDARTFAEAHGRAKLTDAQVGEIRTRAAGGSTHRALSAEFGVGQSQVGRIVRGESRIIGQSRADPTIPEILSRQPSKPHRR